jgi:hypothetical protein
MVYMENSVYGLMQSCFIIDQCGENRNGTSYTTGRNQVEPSDLGPVLHYVSVPFSDFQTKILGVNTPLYLFICHFSFHVTHCWS